MGLLGDPSVIPKGNWRMAEIRHSHLETALFRYSGLFYLYLLAIAFLMVGVLLSKNHDLDFEVVRTWIERGYLFLSSFSFLLTLGLPRALGSVQLARSEAEIEQRRREAGISPPKRT
ncbi:MAG: hypothetical protein J0H35_04515, partial [Rhodospirillales bacterium]|nr:hypothetical protein [Rhodospirillales bacterium]